MEQLMDSSSLFLAANTESIYGISPLTHICQP